jgi:hypothetical protein
MREASTNDVTRLNSGIPLVNIFICVPKKRTPDYYNQTARRTTKGPLSITSSKTSKRLFTMDPGWLFLFLFFVVETFLVTLLVLPMPNNDVRGAITGWVTSLWDNRPVKITAYVMLALNVVYFWFVSDALLHPLYDFGLLRNPFAEGGWTCESKQNLFYNERNAYLTGMSIFMFVILNRLVDIQDKLHKARHVVKTRVVEDQVNKKED